MAEVQDILRSPEPQPCNTKHDRLLAILNQIESLETKLIKLEGANPNARSQI